MKRGLIQIIVACCLWLSLQPLVPAFVHWRDSGEFLISAFFLDITHPPGAPLYSQVANVFALIPFGPIAWRIHSFSCCVVILLLWMSYEVALKLLHLISKTQSNSLIALLAPLALLGSETLLKAANTAEVYALNALLFLSLILLSLAFERTKDFRYLLATCLLSGLAVGNHVVMGLLGLICAPFIILGRPFSTIKPILLPGLLFGLFGLGIYSYIPARTLTYPPLNTGSPNSIERLADHLTDARDRNLRHSVELSTTTSNILSQTWNDLRRMSQDLPWPLLLLGACGIISSLIIIPRYGFILALGAIANWKFFAGWDPDPWILTFGALALGVCLLTSLGFQTLKLSNRSQNIFMGIILVTLLTRAVDKYIQLEDSGIKSFDLASQSAQDQLSKLPPNAVYLTEASWFITKYLQSTEGYRTDLKLVYQPSVLFPNYFSPLNFAFEDNENFNSEKIKLDIESSLAPELQRLASFIEYSGRKAPLFFEPNMVINGFLSGILQCTGEGQFSLVPHQSCSISNRCVDSAIDQIGNIKSIDSPNAAPFINDTINYFEARTTGLADLLGQVEKGRALDVLESLCLPLKTSFCSLTALNNLAVGYIDTQQNDKAAVTLLTLLEKPIEAPQAVINNLRNALLALPLNERHRLSLEFPKAKRLIEKLAINN